MMSNTKINPCSKCGKIPHLQEVGAVEYGDSDSTRLMCDDCWEGDDCGQFYAWSYEDEDCIQKWNKKNPLR